MKHEPQASAHYGYIIRKHLPGGQHRNLEVEASNLSRQGLYPRIGTQLRRASTLGYKSRNPSGVLAAAECGRCRSGLHISHARRRESFIQCKRNVRGPHWRHIDTYIARNAEKLHITWGKRMILQILVCKPNLIKDKSRGGDCQIGCNSHGDNDFSPNMHRRRDARFWWNS